jgi:small subunit ribosomal protein S1
VSSIVNFGAFVDLGGVDGLVHVSELSWKHVDHPSEVATVGEEVEVEVLDVDLERERVSLSLKATQEDPWKEFERKYQAGEIITGQVTKLVPFGAFVRVAAGIEGLVHISELSDSHVESPEQVLNVGDEVRVRVIDVDVSRRRISLSMRQVGGAMESPTEGEIEAEPTPQAAPEPTTPEAAPEVTVDDIVEEALDSDNETSEILRDAEERADESDPEVLEAAMEGAPPAPEVAALHVESEDQAQAEEEQAEQEGDVSLESILEDLKRREGRTE